MKGSLGIYIHVPFCEHKCSYCDFNSWEETSIAPQLRWIKGIKYEFESYFKLNNCRRFNVKTIFIGGGTPSLLNLFIFEELSMLIHKYCILDNDYEWTVECNPEALSFEHLNLYNRLGVNRLSVGIQSFSQESLAQLERRATPKKNKEILNMIAMHWGHKWSCDLIFAIPGQTLNKWVDDLEIAISFSPKHISAYQLTLSTPRARLWQQKPEDELLEYFRKTDEILSSAALPKYETSNFAKAGHESIHNMRYWALEPFLAFGPGAYGFLSSDSLSSLKKHTLGMHYKRPAHFERWLDSTSKTYDIFAGATRRTLVEAWQEKLIQGMRLLKGVCLGSYPELQARLRCKMTAADYELFEWRSETVLAPTSRGTEILDFAVLNLIKKVT